VVEDSIIGLPVDFLMLSIFYLINQPTFKQRARKIVDLLFDIVAGLPLFLIFFKRQKKILLDKRKHKVCIPVQQNKQ